MGFELICPGKNSEEKQTLKGSTADKKRWEHFAQENNRYKFFSEYL